MNTMEKNTNNTFLSNWVSILGFALIVGGVAICFFIVSELMQVYLDFGSSDFIARIVELLSGKNLLYIDAENSVAIGEGGAGILALMFLFFLSWSGAGIAYALIKNGAQLLSPAFQSDIETIKLKINKLTEQTFYK